MRKNSFSKTVSLVLAGACILGALGCGFTASADEPQDAAKTGTASSLSTELAATDIVAQNDIFALYCDQATANFMIKQKKTGAIWYAYDPGYQDAVTIEDVMAQAGSLLKIEFYDKDAVLHTMTSLTDAVQREQVSYQAIDNGICIEIVMGEKVGESPIPQAISEARMKKMVLDKLESTWDQKKAVSIYTLYSKEETDPDEYEQLCKNYPLLKQESIYILNSDLEDAQVDATVKFFRQVGYTVADAQADNKAVGVNIEAASKPYFKFPLQIVLTDKGFTASIDMSAVEYNDNYRLTNITFLEYFGAGRHNQDGELFFPDGSGVMMAYGNDETLAPVKEISSVTYGDNYALTADNITSIIQDVRIPVFGNLNTNGGYLAVMRDGDAIARLIARTSDENNLFNTAYATFVVRSVDEFKFEDWGSAGYSWLAFEQDLYSGSLTIDYMLMDKEHATLSDMASLYRNHLKQTGVISEKVQSKNIPFYLETLGYYTRKDRFIGIPINKKTPLTTFEQAEEMLSVLSEKGVKNLQLRYLGYANNGMKNMVYNKLNIEGSLGGASQFKRLIQYTLDNGIGFYPDMELSLVAADKWFDGFSASRDGIRTLDKKYGGWAETQLSDGVQNKETFHYAVSADKIQKNAQKLMKSFEKLTLTSASFGSLGEHLNANYYKRNSVNRQESMSYLAEVFASYGEKYDLMTRGGNLYTLKESDHILNLPTQSSRYNINGYEVPFIQMVLHGYKQYAGVPLNLSGQHTAEILQAVATGSGIYFNLNYDNTEYLKDSDYSNYYSTRFEDWVDEAITMYQKANAVLSNVHQAEMIQYEMLSDDVSKTVYDNGKAVIVNYSDQAFTYQGKTVPANDFALVTE